MLPVGAVKTISKIYPGLLGLETQVMFTFFYLFDTRIILMRHTARPRVINEKWDIHISDIFSVNNPQQI